MNSVDTLPDSKRIKTTPPTPPTQPSSLSITDYLTDDHLVSIASYLPGTSCVNLTVALTAPSEAWLSDTSRAIISASQDSWETLDFANFGDVVANKLTDDDIRAILVCIDAKNKVKILRLRSCTLLVGHGLEPLRGSTVLEDIDLSQTTGYIFIETTPFSQASILSILENILDIEGGLQKHLNMDRDIPKEWRKDSEFVQNLKQLLLSKGTCEAHDMNCSGELVACLTCFRSFCDIYQHTDGHWINTCDKCGVTMCDDSCENFAYCDGCDTTFCSVCKEDTDEDFAKCYGCGESYCSVCKEDVDVDAARQCHERYCGESRCLSCGPECEHCLGLHVPKLIARNERLAGDNETLKNENNQLHQEIEELRK